MEISLRLDTLGFVEVVYLRTRERYRDWPPFQLLGASRQARVFAYFTRDIAEQLHQQILMIESALGLDGEGEDEDEEDDDFYGDDLDGDEGTRASEREGTAFSPAFAQALKQLNELARQRLPEDRPASPLGRDWHSDLDPDSDEYALEQLQEVLMQMMEVVRELAEEMATDALKITSRLEVARTNIEFFPRAEVVAIEDDEEDDEASRTNLMTVNEKGVVDLEVELIMLLQLYEKGRARPEDLPAIELQLDVDDFERLHETLDIALERERRGKRRR